jgi:hypothetical protein
MRALERLARNYLKLRGYRVPKAKNRPDRYALFSYGNTDGSFDYERYRAIQERGNKQKVAEVWADEQTIQYIASYLKTVRPGLKHGLCHGVRRGTEQRWFAEQLGIDVLGTDISETARQFPNVVQWDFHDAKPEWIGAFDFVYTNAHDHAYDPKKALDAWIDQIDDDGAVFLEHTMGHSDERTSEMDPFGIDPHVFPFVIVKWGAGKYAVTNILEPPHTKPNGYKIWIFVVTKLKNARSPGPDV